MVGLYHKRRAERSSYNKLWRWVTRLSIFCGGLIILGFAVMILFFNGSQVKGPLSAYLSNKADMDVAIEDAEFSPLYPNIIKLFGVTFGQSSIGELYIEYDLSSAVGNDELQIKDLYLNKVNIEPDDLVSLATTKLGFKSIKVQTVRFHGTPLRTAFLNSPSSTVRLENVTFSAQEGLTFKSGSLSTGCARLFGDEVKSFNIDFEHSEQGIAIKNFSTAILGGTVTGRGFYNLKSLNNEPDKINEPLKDQHANAPYPLIAEIILDELNLSNVIINEGIRAPKNVSLSSKKTNLHDVIFTNDSTGLVSTLPEEKNVFKAPIEHKATLEDKFQEQYLSYIMQGINGSIDELTIDQDSLHGIFQGKIDEISFPNLQTTFENNNTEASFTNNKLEFSLQGRLFEGTYSTAGNFDLTQHHLNITELKLNKNKLALTRPRLEFLKEQFAENSLFIKKAHFFQLEFLSFINSLPLSVQAISGNACNIWVHPQNDFKVATDRLYEILSYITFDHEAKETANENSLKLDKNKFIVNPDIYVNQFNKRQFLKENDCSTLKLKLINMLYSDLLMRETEMNLTLSEQGLAIDLDKLLFKESSLSAQGFLSLKKNNKSKLTIKAHDFESADLNSNLIGHMLTGKINLDADIESNPQKPCFKSLLAYATGSVTLNSEALLIADFGLDLINGGKKASYELTTTELLSAIQGSVAGINNLDIKTTLDQGQAKASGTATLVTSLLSFDSTLDLKEDQVSGRAFLISRAKDSSTQVTLSGNSSDPKFNIKALKRGEKRPGLYLPQYEASAHAKERTDAAVVLKGLIAPLLAPAKSTTSDSSIQSALIKNTVAPAPDTKSKNTEAKDNNSSREVGTTTLDKVDDALDNKSKNTEAQDNNSSSQAGSTTIDKVDDALDDKSKNTEAKDNNSSSQAGSTTIDKVDDALDNNSKNTEAKNHNSSSQAGTNPLNKLDGANNNESSEDTNLNHEEMLQLQADEMEQELFKDALIDSIINGSNDDEEELLF